LKQVERTPNAEVTTRRREELRITWVGLGINLGLGAVKTTVGILAHSTVLVADGLHSLSDLASDLAVLWGIRAARVPPDSNHHYGHRRYEAVVTMIVGLLLLATATYVALHSILSFGLEHAAPDSWWPFWIAVGSIVLKEFLFWATRAVGRRHRNTALLANAWHHRTDSFSSIAAALGIGATLVLGPRWAFLDHLTAVILAAFLVVVGIRIVRDALRELSDQAPGIEDQRRMRELISGIPGVVGFHAFRARRTGGLVEMDVHIQVAPHLTVRQGHDIATRVEQHLCDSFPQVAGIVVHIEPAGP
jgi:cation diffusion facilitator family transporter